MPDRMAFIDADSDRPGRGGNGASMPSDIHPIAIEILASGLSAFRDQPVRITAATAKPLKTASVHPIDRLCVTLPCGEELPVIFKQLRAEPERRGAGREREVLLYERLLSGRQFGAPALYASLHDEERGRFWLFLEDVGNWRLEYCDITDWLAAFRWLARLHATYHGREAALLALDCLGEHDSVFYHALADGARDALARSGDARSLVRLDRLLDTWLDDAIAFLTRQPRTLIHGDLSGKNLLVQPDPGIRPVDWEWAAIGPAAWDLVKLLDGWGKKKPDLLAAYLDEFARSTTARIDPRTLDASLTHCENLKALWYLRWWIAPCQDPAFVDGLIGGMETRWRRLESEGAHG